jgi:hypothetical protein
MVMMRIKAAIGIMIAMTLVFVTFVDALASDKPQIPTVVLEAVKAETEPGRFFVANDQGVLNAIRTYHQRPESESEAVMAELDIFGLNNLPPPFMMEYARREWLLGRDDWAERYLIGRMRALFDAKVCKDLSARQFKVVIEIEFEQFEDFINAYNSNIDENIRPYIRKHLESGTYFQSNASAWWVCSHGMQAMEVALSNGPKMALADWFVGDTERDNIQAEAIEQLSLRANSKQN